MCVHARLIATNLPGTLADILFWYGYQQSQNVGTYKVRKLKKPQKKKKKTPHDWLHGTYICHLAWGHLSSCDKQHYLDSIMKKDEVFKLVLAYRFSMCS